MRLTHNYWGVLLSLIVSGFPFAFLLMLSYISGIDPTLARSGDARREPVAAVPADLPAAARANHDGRMPVVRAGILGVPSAVLLGAPARPTRVISIAAAEAAFESYDYSLASAIAIVMGFVQLLVVASISARAASIRAR